MNVSKFYYTAYSENNGKSAGVVLAEKGDLLFFNSFINFTIIRKKILSIFDGKDGVLYVDRQINTIVVSSEYNQLPILKNES